MDAEHVLYAAEREVMKNEETVIGTVIIILLLSCVVLGGCYFFLKNRGSLFGGPMEEKASE